MRIKWLSLVRIMGMLMVLLYHFWPSIFTGGFIGVDVFMTLSGYLTTAVFLEEFGKKQSIELIGFYRRRLYRIFPPLALMVMLVLPFTLLIRSDFRAGLASQLAAVFGFVTNYFEIATGASYENQFVPHLFVHTWTLAVEVQFYFIWGMIIWGLSQLAKQKEHLRTYIFGVATLCFLISFVRLILGSHAAISLSSVYYATGQHGFTFFLGAILASLVGLEDQAVIFKKTFQSFYWPRSLYLVVGSVLVLLPLVFLLKFDHILTYWLGFLLTSLATVAMILGIRSLHDQTVTVQEPVILTYLADLSYGIYLFHWPFLIIFSELGGRTLAIPMSLLLSLVLANLSFYVIEPCLMGKSVHLFGVPIKFQSSKKVFLYFASPFLLFTLILVIISPRIGALEKDLMVKGLDQAGIKINQLRDLADGQKASDYGVSEGVLIIGDSVALRASDGITKVIKDAEVDGEVSRNLKGAYETLMSTAKSGSLPQTVILAAGTNIINDYQEQLDKIIEDLPQGHRLILVTPYDGRVAGNPEATVNLTRTYELELAEKYDWITVADWYKVASNNPKIWHYTDYVHFGSDSDSIAEGQELYADMLVKALKQSAKDSVKKNK